MDIEKLAAVLAIDHPETGAYAADATTAAAQINVVNVVRNKTSLTGREIAAEIVDSEYNALTNEVIRGQVIALVSTDSVDPFGFAENVLKKIFGNGSATIIALAAARVETVSQATAEGLGFVYPGHIEAARA